VFYNWKKWSIYDDVIPSFERMIAKGYKIYIYSSGSIEAQKLLFQYTEKGDVLKVKIDNNLYIQLFNFYFKIYS
jgi:methionine salvage enolase-phosphatase E1